jgi:hypothetical protein
MAKIRVYQFTKYDIATDDNVKSHRWGTREAIQEIGATILESTAVEIDESFLGRQMTGLSDIGFNPTPRREFQTQVTS